MFYRNREDSVYHRKASTLFSCVPDDVLSLITAYPSLDPDAIKLFKHLAFGERAAAEEMIKTNLRLLFHACAKILTPSGRFIDYPITAPQLALLSGDDKAAKMIKSYLFKTQDGEKFWNEQYERCKPHIDNLENMPPSYNIRPLIDIIIKGCSKDEITAALGSEKEGINKDLQEALTAFRAHFTRERRMTTFGMHFNYSDLRQVYEIYAEEIKMIKNEDDFNNHGCRFLLIWQKIIAFIMRDLPAYDRQIFARGLEFVVKKQDEDIVGETFKFQNNQDYLFPDARSDDYLVGEIALGRDVGITLSGNITNNCDLGIQSGGAKMLKILCEKKCKALQNLYSRIEASPVVSTLMNQ